MNNAGWRSVEGGPVFPIPDGPVVGFSSNRHHSLTFMRDKQSSDTGPVRTLQRQSADSVEEWFFPDGRWTRE